MLQIAERESTSGVGQVAPGTPPPEGIERFHVVLIHPSKYDDDGYVMRYVRGVLPTNTLAVLAGLTEEVAAKRLLGDVEVETLILDELVQKIDVARLARRCGGRRSRALVALCGVQTNQFPRAADLARRFHAAGMSVMIGGFHVSGAIALSRSGMPPECQALLDDGITLVKGEVEDCWADLLRDALHGRLKGYYDICASPDLSRAGLPTVDPKLMKRFAYPYMGTIDAGRGCPFSCSFCTIINVQGRRMRHRTPEAIRDRIRRNATHHIDYYFFTDDNFARNPAWEGIFDALIDLRRREGIEIQFMMQVDVLAYRTKGFMSKAAEAGCSQVFIGMETLNPANIPAAGKRQNRVEDYRRMIDAWHDHGIACHVGYIIGFPFDTPESVREDVRRLRDELDVDQASFFMLTPLPGSQDHVEMVERGGWMEPDYNRFDSFHPTTHHGTMTHDEWFASFRNAWRDFYTVDAMKAILARANSTTYWGLFKNFAWYRYAAFVEETPPMICGFLRIKDRKDRRPGFAVQSAWRHYRQRLHETARWLRETARLYFEMQEVWLATRRPTRWETNIEGWRRRYTEARGRLNESAARAGVAIGRQLADARTGAGGAWTRARQIKQQAAEDLTSGLGRLRQAGREVPTAWWQRLVRRINLFAIRTPTRAHLDAYWSQTWSKLRRGRLYRINPLSLAWNAFRDVKLCTAFSVSVLAGYGK